MAELVLVAFVCGFMGFVIGFGAAVVGDAMGRGRWLDDAP